MDHTVVITGSSGYLGSARCADLGRDHHVIGVDLRPPSLALRQAVPRAIWENIDISDAEAVSGTFLRTARAQGGIDFVIHFAVYYHCGRRWRREYDLHHIQGTSHVTEAACRAGGRSHHLRREHRPAGASPSWASSNRRRLRHSGFSVLQEQGRR